MTEWTSPCSRMTLRLGRWQDVLGDVTECDAVITDIPYSERVIDGYRSYGNGRKELDRIQYCGLSHDDLHTSMLHWTLPKLNARWLFIMCSHDQWQDLQEMFGDNWYTFAPVAIIRGNAPPRFAADGPTSSVDWCFVARPKDKRWRDDMRSRPGHYMTITPPGKQIVVGTKTLSTMRAIVKDYSRPGQVVRDPYAGSGTTLLAAAMEGRRAIGAEMDPKTYALAVKRLSKGYTERLFREGITGKQEKLL